MSYLLFLKVDHPGRNSHNRYTRRQNIFHHNRTSADSYIVSDAYSAENLCVLSDIDIVANHRRIIRISAVAPDATITVDDTTFANAGLGIDDNGAKVLNMQIFAEASGTDDESQAGTQPIFPSAIPKTKQLVWFLKCKSFLFP